MKANLWLIVLGCILVFLSRESLAIISNVGETQIRDNSRYPCDVFSYSFCFRKPDAAVVKFQSGPDFDIYEVLGPNETRLFSIYVGTAPEEVPDGATTIGGFNEGGVKVKASSFPNSAKEDSVELRLSYPNGLTLHVFNVKSAASKMALAETLSSFRVCSKRGFTSTKCKSKPLFDNAFILSIIQ